MAEIGVGAQPVAQKKLNADNLAAAIDLVTSDKQIRERAQALGEKIRAEDGIGRGVEFLTAATSG